MTSCHRLGWLFMDALMGEEKMCYKIEVLIKLIYQHSFSRRLLWLKVSITNHNPRVIVHHYLECVRQVGGELFLDCVCVIQVIPFILWIRMSYCAAMWLWNRKHITGHHTDCISNASYRCNGWRKEFCVWTIKVEHCKLCFLTQQWSDLISIIEDWSFLVTAKKIKNWLVDRDVQGIIFWWRNA